MEINDVISKIQECIIVAHSFSKDLGDKHSIHRDYLLSHLNDITLSQINQALLTMKEDGEIELSNDFNIIHIVKNNL